jgi:hypothetical protein
MFASSGKEVLRLDNRQIAFVCVCENILMAVMSVEITSFGSALRIRAQFV